MITQSVAIFCPDNFINFVLIDNYHKQKDKNIEEMITLEDITYHNPHIHKKHS
jgi:hypothetical protein